MIACPKCGSVEHYHKVSALVESETSHINSTTNTVGLGVSVTNIGVGGATGNTFGIQRSALAERLLPPKKPEPVLMPLIVSCVMGFGAGIFIMSIFGLGPWSSCILITSVIVGVVFIPKSGAQETLDKKEYQSKLATWNRRWVCKRCGTVSEQEEL